LLKNGIQSSSQAKREISFQSQNQEKERFLTPQTPFGMTNLEFFDKLLKLKTQNSKLKTQNSKLKTQNLKLNTANLPLDCTGFRKSD